MARKPQGWHPEDVRAELRKRFGSMAAFARSLGRARSTVANVIRVPGYSIPLEGEIARAIGEAPVVIWPDRYHADGSPRSYRESRDHSGAANTRTA